MDKFEFIKNEQQLFNKQVKDVFDKEPFVIIFTDAVQSSAYGCHSYLTMYNCLQRSWRESLRELFNGTLRYYGRTINKWTTYKCKCGCNSFYIWKHWYVCSRCFTKHILSAENTIITFKDEEKCGPEFEYDAKAIIKWHKFGLITKYEFDKFMKDCTNKEQEVYFGYNSGDK